METQVRSVGSLVEAERSVIECIIGRALREPERVVIQIWDVEPPTASAGAAQLPAWCNVLGDLSVDELAEFDAVIARRADLSRPPH
jgi:DNA-binding transcriptional regulator PaaX